jgi:diguanylate cyclase (GGDEF)-like protein/PAS domain S-box-containing protein
LYEPTVDIALLLILVLFFGRVQSQRPESYYRLWFVGWVFVLMSYAVWMVRASRTVYQHVQDALRLDLMLIGTLLFLVSFVITQEKVRKVVLQGMLVGVPIVLVFNAMEFVRVPRLLLIACVVAWEAYGIRAACLVIPKGRTKTRFAIFSICVVCGVAISFYVALTSGQNIFELALAEVVVCSAVLYGGGLQRRTLATYIGMTGFVFWGGFYIWADFFGNEWPRALAVLFLFWIVPKYFVGSSMVMKTFEDETQEKATLAEAYRQLYEDLRMMYEEHPHPMWTRDIATGMFLSVNRAMVQVYGYTAEELLTMRETDLLAPAVEREQSDGLVPDLLEGTRVRHRHKEGRLMWITLAERDIMVRGGASRLVMARDITERVKVSQELERRANYDELTGLANRRLLDDRILQSFKRCERDGRKATLLTIDVDHFKQINDTYGHQVGDECLQIVAARLASKIRQVDTIARVGGEEFAAIIGGLHCVDDAGTVAESLLRIFGESMQIGTLDVYVTVSIGIAVYPDDAQDAETLKRRSDEALYGAKRAGRNCVMFASAMVSPVVAESVMVPVRGTLDVTMVTDEMMGL